MRSFVFSEDVESRLKSVDHLIPKWMKKYALHTIKKYKMDSSHDLTHFYNVARFADYIMKTNYQDIFITTRRLLIHAAFVHDLIDKKYMLEEEGIANLVAEFQSQCYPRDDIGVLIILIKNMSYSVRKEKIRNGEDPYSFDDSDCPPFWSYLEGKNILQTLLKILCDADQLDAYRPERIIQYQSEKSCQLFGAIIPQYVDSWSKTIMVKRVLKYLPGDFIQTPAALEIARILHPLLEKYVKENYPDELEMQNYD